MKKCYYASNATCPELTTRMPSTTIVSTTTTGESTTTTSGIKKKH